MAIPGETELQGLRVLVVEDTLLIAELIADELAASGCTVVGPVPRLDKALDLVAKEPLDGALLDVNLAGEVCFPIAEVLAARGVPFIFLTGYGEAALPANWRDLPRLSKPFQLEELNRIVRCHFLRR